MEIETENSILKREKERLLWLSEGIAGEEQYESILKSYSNQIREAESRTESLEVKIADLECYIKPFLKTIYKLPFESMKIKIGELEDYVKKWLQTTY